MSAELDALVGNPEELHDRFYRDLAFGTGGLRGVMGAGTNRMNIYTVRKTTLGLSRFLKKTRPDAAGRGVVIAYDSRAHSRDFAEETARVLRAQGVKAYCFTSLRPTPELSFAVRHLNAAAGVVITASHNPKEYNGYKVYGADGVQALPEVAEAIAREIGGFSDMAEVSSLPDDASLHPIWLDSELDDAYLDALRETVLRQDVIAAQTDMKILYTPLHGAGAALVPRALRENGFTNVSVVAEQEEPDSNFSTVPSPNPEEPSAFAMAVAQGKKTGAELILGTDPDADRLGALAWHGGEFVPLSGNQLGCLMLSYLLEQGQWGEAPYAVRTIVTTPMARAICAARNVPVVDVLTGFKYIGHVAETRPGRFVFGFEESFGFLAGDAARDKDAVCAALLTAETAAFHRARGHTLLDALDELYARYGYYREALRTITLPGAAGQETLGRLMASLRARPPARIGARRVTAFHDLLSPAPGDGLPAADVVRLFLEGDAWVCIRPSGTEPKLKLYCGVRGSSAEDAGSQLAALLQSASRFLET